MYVESLKYGPTAFNVIEGAAKYLKQLPFVDSNKLGCGSHSWSAKLGAYIFTHSSSFAATTISEGFLYGNVLNMAFSPKGGRSRLEDTEVGMEYGNFWENKNAWLDQTTVLNVDKAASPLLLLCNKESTEDYQDQTFQFFTALRRLEKNVWWLKYEKGSHTLNDQDEIRDFTIRDMQFFDHYLKEAPAPKWMTQGMSAQINGVETYKLDPAGSCSYSNKSKCTICEKWNAKYLKDPKMFEKPIREWKLDN
jgi:dipeptidyl aminopeptidase/acylaminoacyl peptidase